MACGIVCIVHDREYVRTCTYNQRVIITLIYTHTHTHTHSHTPQPPMYSTPSHSSSLMSGSPTNTMKPAISEASTTLTGGAMPLAGYPNAAVHGHHLSRPHANMEQPDMTSSVANNNGGSRPPPGGGNPMVNYPQLPAVNVAPPLHSPGDYQYRFVQAPAFPRHPPPNNNNSQQHRLGNQSQSPAAMACNGHPPAVSSMSGISPQRNHIAATEQFTNLNHRNSREIGQQYAPTTPTTVQYHLESTV